MRIGALLVLLLTTAGCEVTPGRSGVFQPEVDETTRASNLAAEFASDTDGFQLDGYKQEQAEADAEAGGDEADALARELGADGVALPEDPPTTPAPVGPPLAPPGYPPAVGQPMPPAGAAAPPPPRWTPADAVTLSWGLRLVSTVDGATPPRAILGLPDGSEEVVKAGDLLPEAGVIVLAVGQDVVQLGRVEPAGDHAKVDTVFLQAMFRDPRSAQTP